MSKPFSRRKLITTGLATVAGAAGLAEAARLGDRYGLIPPDHGGIYGIGETLTYASQRLLSSHHSLAREFDRSQISKVFPVNGDPPLDETYQRLLAGQFADWRLKIDGLVSRPSAFSLAELKSLPSRTQITQQACEEGWSFIAEWTGVPLSYILNLAGVLPQARYVVVFPSMNSGTAWTCRRHCIPQTLLAYAMNGEWSFRRSHGAPLRLRVPRQLGYKKCEVPCPHPRCRYSERSRRRHGIEVSRNSIFLVRGHLIDCKIDGGKPMNHRRQFLKEAAACGVVLHRLQSPAEPLDRSRRRLPASGDGGRTPASSTTVETSMPTLSCTEATQLLGVTTAPADRTP